MMNKILLMIIALVVVVIFDGCTMKMGPYTYNTFKKNRDFEVGFSIYNKKYVLRYKNKRMYEKNYYLYIVEYPKNCIFGYITDKNNTKQIIKNWILISGKKFCKEQEIIGGGEII